MAAAAVKKELDEMKAILEPKVNEMDNRLNGMATEISKLPGFEAKVDGVEKRLTEYTENLAIQQAKTTELKMTEDGPRLVEVNAGRFNGIDFKSIVDVCVGASQSVCGFL